MEDPQAEAGGTMSPADQQSTPGGPPPPPSPLSGCYLLIVIGEPHSPEHKEIILQKIAKGFLSWNVDNAHVDLEKELQALTNQAPEGEEARNGERLIQYATENLVTEVLIHPQLNTLLQCIRNLLSSFTRHRHLIHAGYTFAGNGSWILQDGTFSLADFIDAFQETEVQRVLRAYENCITVDVHCSPEGDWSTERLSKETFSRMCKVRVNPDDCLTAGGTAIGNFMNYMSPFLRPASIEQLLEPSDVVGNIRFSHPTLYVFPGGQGDAALFGINGFNMLVDGGFARKACFWDFARHLDRLDAVLMTRLNNGNINGIAAVLRRKKISHVYPQIGHFFSNIQERRHCTSPDGDKDRDPLLVNLADEGHEMVLNLRHLQLRPHPCYRDGSHIEPVNLYHKVGHGKLDMYIISPARDSREVKEFLTKWNSNDPNLFSSHSKKDVSKEFHFPLQNLISICALLVWQPANPADTITRILFPGSTPQHKIFEGLDKLRNLEFLKYPVCSARSLSPSASAVGISSRVSSKQRSAPAVIDKLLPGEGVKASSKTGASETNKQPPTPKAATIPVASITEVKQTKPATALMSTPVSLTKAQPQAKPKPEKVTSKQEPAKPKTEIIKSLEGEKTSAKMEKVTKTSVEVTKTKAEHKTKTETKTSVTKTRTESKPPRSIERKSQKVSATSTAKSSPTTPKKSIDAKVNGIVSKAETVKTTRTSSKTRPSPTATPAKSTKEANNRKVVESKYHVSRVSSVSRTSASRLTKKESQETTTKSERKPISRRPKTASPSKAPASRPPGSPAKSSSAKSTPTPSVKSDKDGVIRKAKGEGDKITTDSSAVSTPSTVDQDTAAALKGKGIEADEKIPHLVNGDLTKEEKSVVEEIEDAIATVESREEIEEKIEVTESVAAVSEVVELTAEEIKETESTAEETEVETEEVVEEEGKDIEKESEAADEEDIEQKKLLQEKDDMEPTEEEKTEEIDEIEEIEAERPIDLQESLQAELQLEEAKQEGKEGVEEDEEEYLIIEKEEVEESVQEPESIESHLIEETGQQEVETEEEEGELQKHQRDEVESEKQLKEIITDEQEIKVNGIQSHDEEEEEEEEEEHETIEREDVAAVKKEISPVLEKEELLKKVDTVTKEEVEREAKEVTEGPLPTPAQPEHDGLTPETKEQLEEEVQEIITSAKEIVTKSKLEAEGKVEETQVQPQKDKLKDQISDERKDTEETEDLKEISSTSPEEKLDISSEKNKEATEDTRDTDQKLEEEQDEGIEVKETGSREVPDQRYPAEESQPDEKFSTTIESAATTAPTLPEDERIPLDEIKEIVEEKYVKEETKEKEKPVEVPVRLEQPTTLPQVVMPPGIGIFDPRVPHVIMHQRDIVKTPDEVADLPVHEEVDPGMYESDDFARDFQKPKDEIVSFKKLHEFEDTRQQSPELHIKGELQLKYDEVARPVDDKKAEAKQEKTLPVSDLEIKEGIAIEEKEDLDAKPLVCPTTDREVPLEKVSKEVLDTEQLVEEKEPETADKLPDQEIKAVDKEVSEKLQQDIDKQEKPDEHAKVDDKVKEETETQEEEKKTELEDVTKSEITDIESKDKDTEKEFLRQEIMKPDTKEVKDITAHFLEAEISSVKAEIIPLEKDEVMPKYPEEELKDQQKDKPLEGAEISHLKEEVKEMQLEEKREIKLPTSKFDEKLLPTLFSGIVEVMADTVLDSTDIKTDQMEEDKDVKDTQEEDKLHTELAKEIDTSGVIEKDVQEKEDTHAEEVLQPPSGLSATYLEIIEKLQKDTPSPVDAKPDLVEAEPQKVVDDEEESKPEMVKMEKSPTEEVSLPEDKAIKEAEETLKPAAVSEPHITPSEPEAKAETGLREKSPDKDIVMPGDKSPELLIEHKEEELSASESKLQKDTDKTEELRLSSEKLSKDLEDIQDLEPTEEKDKPIKEADKDIKKEEEVEFTAKKIDEVTKIKEKELIKTEITEVKAVPEEKESKITDKVVDEVEEAPCIAEKVPEVQEVLVPSKPDEEERQVAEAKGKEKPDEQEQGEEEPKEKVIHKEEEKETITKLDEEIIDIDTKKVDEIEVSDIPKVSTEKPDQKETEVKLVTESKISTEISDLKPSEIASEVHVKEDIEEESIKIKEREPSPEEKERTEIDAEYLTKEEEEALFHDHKTLTMGTEVTKIEVTETEKKSVLEEEDKQVVELPKAPMSVEEKEMHKEETTEVKKEPIKTKDEKVEDEEIVKEEEPFEVKSIETVEDEESAKIKQVESIIKEEKPVKEEEIVKDEKEEPVKIKDEDVKSKDIESVDIKEEKPAKLEEPLKTKDEDIPATKVDVTIKEDEDVKSEEKESDKIKEEKPVTKEEPDKAKEEPLTIKEDVSLQREEDETIKITEDVSTKPREEELKDEIPSKTEEKEPLPVLDSFKIKDDGTTKITEEVSVKPTEEESRKIKDEEPGKTVEEEHLPIKKEEQIKEDEAVKIEEDVSVKITEEELLKTKGEEPVKVAGKEPDDTRAAMELDKEEPISIKEQKPTEAKDIEHIISKQEVEKKEHSDIEEIVTKTTDEKLTKPEEVETKEKEEHIMEEHLLDAEKEEVRKEKQEEVSLVADVVKEKEVGRKETEEKEYLKMEENELPEPEKKPSPDVEEKMATDTKPSAEISEKISPKEPVHDMIKDEHEVVSPETIKEPAADTRQPEEVIEKEFSKVSEHEPVKDDKIQRTKSPEIEEEISTSTKVDIVIGLSPKKEEPAKEDQLERTESPESEGVKEPCGTEREETEVSSKITPPIKGVDMEKLLAETEKEISVDAGVKVTLEEREKSPEPSAEVGIREEPTKMIGKEDETLQKETPQPDLKDQFKTEEVKDSETIEKKEIITEEKLTETKLIPDTDDGLKAKEEVDDKKMIKTDEKPSSETEGEKPGKSITPVKSDEPVQAEEIKEKDGETVLAEVKEFITKEIEKRLSEEEADIKETKTIFDVESIKIIKTETVMEEFPAPISKVEEELSDKEKEKEPIDTSKIDVTKEEKLSDKEKEEELTDTSKIDIAKEEKLADIEKEPTDTSKTDTAKEEKLADKEKEKESTDASKIDVTKEEKLPDKEKEEDLTDTSKIDIAKEEKLSKKEKEKEAIDTSKVDTAKEEKSPDKDKEKEPIDTSKVDIVKEEKLDDKEKEKEPTDTSKIDIKREESKEPSPPKPASPLEHMEIEKEVEDRKSDDEHLDEEAGDGEPPPSPGEEYIDSGLEEEPVYAKLEAPEHPEYVTVTPDSTPVSPKPLPGFKPASLVQEEEDITMKISVTDSKPSAPVMDSRETKSVVMEETVATTSEVKELKTIKDDAQIIAVLTEKVTELKEKISDEVKDVHEAKDKVDITTVSAEESARDLSPSPVDKVDAPLSSKEKVVTSVTKHVEEFLLAEKGMEESLRTEVSSSEITKQTKSEPEKEKDLYFVPEKETTVEKLVDEKVEKDELDEHGSETASDSEEKLSQEKVSTITSTKESVIEALSTASISTSVITSSVVSAVSSAVTHISSLTKDVTSSSTDGTTEEKADVESSEKDIILAEKITKEDIPTLTPTISEDSLERKASPSSSVTSEDIDITSEKTSESILKEVSSTITSTSAVAATATASTVFTSTITPSLSSMKDDLTKETSSIISSEATTVTERVSKTEERDIYDSDLSTSTTVKRMVVTASSEDGGTETELCPTGSISFPSSIDTQVTSLSSETHQISSEQDITSKTSASELSSTITVHKDQVQPATETVSTKTVTSVKRVGDTNGDVHVSDQEVHSSGDEERVGGKVVTRKTTTTTTTRRVIRSVSDKESESDDDHRDSVTEETITGEDGRTVTRRITRRYITKVIKKDGESDDDDRSSTGSVIMDDGPGSPRITTTKTSRTVTKREGLAPDLDLEGDDFSEGSDGGIVTTKTTRTTTTVTKKQSSDADGEVISTTTQEVVTGDGASKTTTITVKDEHGDVSVKTVTEPLEDITSAGSSRFVGDVLKDSLCGVISSAEKMSKEIMEETTSKQATEVNKIDKSSTEKLLTNGELLEKDTEKSKTTITTSTVETTKHHDDVPGSPTVLGGAVAAVKKEVSELARSTTPGSDVLSDRDLDLGGPLTPHSDISSGQVSRAATNIWGGSESRPESRHCDSDEEDGPVSPMSVTSQVAHSPPSHFDFEMGDPHGISKDLTKHSSAHHETSDMHKKTHIMSTSMTSSLYGSLPTEQEQELLEHRNGKPDKSIMSTSYMSDLGSFSQKTSSSHFSTEAHTMDDESVDFERALYEHRAARGEDLAASSSPLTTHHYEIKRTEAKGSPSHTVKYEHHYSTSGVNGQRSAGDHSLREFTEDYGNGNIAGAKQFEDVMNRNRDIKHVLEEKYNGKSDDGFGKFDMPLPSSYKQETFTTSSITPGSKLPSGTEERKTTVTTTTVISSSSGMEHDPMFHHQFPMPSMTGQAYPEPPQEFGQSSASKPDVKKDPIEGWGKPLGLPAPAPPPITDTQGDVNINTNKTTPKKEKKAMQIKKSMIMNENNKTSGGQTGKDSKTKSPESPVKQKGGSNKEIGRNTKSSVNPIYVDLSYVPHHGNSYYTSVEFFKKVRARYYVFSGTEPSREVYNALLEAKQTWEDKELEVTIIPTYDTDTLGYWVAENEDLLAKCKIDLSPSASRCTINLQDHETSCSAYRLEF